MLYEFLNVISLRGILSIIFILLGLFFCSATVVGVTRLPDFYSRCHSSGNSETLSLILMCIGFMIQAGANLLSVKLAILCLIVCVCNPIGTNVLCQTAYTAGHPVYRIPGRKQRLYPGNKAPEEAEASE